MLTTSWRLLVLSVWLTPFVGVGLLSWWGLGLGTGIQPAYLPMLFLLLGVIALHARSCPDFTWSDDATFVALALGWTALTTVSTWRLDDVGLAGEVAWAKSLKQTAMLTFFVAVAVSPSVLVRCTPRPEKWLARLERGASLALAVAVSIAILQLIAHRTFPAAAESIGRLFASNPSIAAGSDELYLGHSFTGIVRARGSFPEPLHLGNFLIAAMPVTAGMAVGRKGWSRWWRAVVAIAAVGVLLVTYSRGAYLGLAAVGALSVVATVRGALPRPSFSRRALVVVGIVALGSAWLGSVAAGVDVRGMPQLLVDRALQSLAGHDMSNLTRVWAWRAAWEMFLEHPVAGVGWGAYGFHYYRVAGAMGSGAHFGWPMANDMPLLVLAETGLVGLALWARALWPALRWAFADRRDVHFQGRSWGAMCTVTAIAGWGVLVHTLTFSQWNLPHIWLLLGISAALAGRKSEVV